MTNLTDSIHLKQTAAFIAVNPKFVSFIRHTRTPTESGGWVWTHPRPLPGQFIRYFSLNLANRSLRSVVSADGRTVTLDTALIGMPSLDVSVGDVFEVDGATYEVGYVDRIPSWRTYGEMSNRG